jgi:hypothetical protein
MFGHHYLKHDISRTTIEIPGRHYTVSRAETECYSDCNLLCYALKAGFSVRSRLN